MLSITSPLQIAAIIVKSEIISKIVSLFVNPLIIIASKTFMHAYINKTPRRMLTQDKIGENPEIMSNTTLAV